MADAPFVVTDAIAPSWAMAAQAVHDPDDPHLAGGVHLRVATSPLLGLPVGPMLVERIPLGPGARKLDLPATLDWIADDGEVLSPPFEVTPDRGVSGFVPDGEVACWVEVDGHPIDPEGLTLDAVAWTAHGDQVVARRRDAPFAVAASAIRQVRLTGYARVGGGRWLPDRFLASGQPWDRLALPVDGGRPRYAGLPDGEGRAQERVTTGAPTRRPLHDAVEAQTPGDAPAQGPDEDLERVLARGGALLGLLDGLLDDVDTDQLEQVVTEALTGDINADEDTTARIPSLATVLQATLDPGVARWLGFATTDTQPPGQDGDVVVYRVHGVFAPTRRLRADHDRWRQLRRRTRRSRDSGDIVDRIRKESGVDTLRVEGPFVHLHATAAVTLAAPHAAPAPPELGEPDDRRRDGRTAWIPAVPPDARREVRLPLRTAGPATSVAVVRARGEVTAVNPPAGDGRHLPLSPGLAEEPDGPDDREVHDREAPAQAVGYLVAEADWFGRWSGWAKTELAPGVRPQPPQVRVLATYAQPEVAADDTTAVAGTVHVDVPLPRDRDLPPGAHQLLEVTVRLAASDDSPSAGDFEATRTVAVPDDPWPVDAPVPEGEDAGRTVRVALDGPALDPTTSARFTVTATVVDTGGQTSPAADRVELAAYDPRPGPSPDLPTELVYTARPDATGHARFELPLEEADGVHGFRVYLADETGLRTWLRRHDPDGAGELLEDLDDAADDPVARATLWEGAGGLLARGAFELRTDEPLVPDAASGRAVFSHRLPGALRVLTLVRVVSVTEAGVASPFDVAPVVPVAVAVDEAPAPPSLQARYDPEEDVARITVTVPAGEVVAHEVRLRRGELSAGDPMRLPVIAVVAVPPPLEPGADQVVEVEDSGASDLDPGGRLRPWTTATWRAQARAAPPPGSDRPSAWSRAGAAISTSIVPGAAPAAPTLHWVAPHPDAGVTVRAAHDLRLTGGPLGSYQLELHRRLPGDDETRIAAVAAAAVRSDGDDEFALHDDTEVVPAGTRYRVVVIDPLGRRSTASEAVALDEEAS